MCLVKCNECGYLCDDPRHLYVRNGTTYSRKKSPEVYCRNCFERLQYRQFRDFWADSAFNSAKHAKAESDFNRYAEEDLINSSPR